MSSAKIVAQKPGGKFRPLSSDGHADADGPAAGVAAAGVAAAARLE
jgi:hypothetical protein